MTRKYKLWIAVFSLFLFFNGVVKFSVINDQAHRISILEKRTVTSRRVSSTGPVPDMGTEKAEVARILQAVPDIFSFTEQAVNVRELMDKNQFMVQDSLVFNPEKTGAKDLLQYNTKISMAGDYVKIKQFIADIQNLPGLHYIKGLAVTREKENPDRIVLNLELALFFKTYTREHPADKSMVEKRVGPAGLVEDGPVASKFLNKPQISGKVFKDLFSISLPPRKPEEKTDIQALPAKVSVQADPLSEAKAYLASYKIEGTYESGNIKAVFLSKDKLVLVAKVGDRLDGKYLIEDIQKDRVRIKALDLNEIINLDLREFNNE